MKKYLLYIMNIPSPYRWHLFTTLEKICQQHEIDFEVAFLAPFSKRRRWRLQEFKSSFSFNVWQGINFSKNDVRMLNPGLIIDTFHRHWDWIIFGGYDNLTNTILISLPLPRTRSKIIRNEGNLKVKSISSGPIASFKRFLLKRCNGHLVPGKRGLLWLRYWSKSKVSNHHIFPNVIDEIALQDQMVGDSDRRIAIKIQYGLSNDKRIWFTPARLSPEKGLLEFLDAIPKGFGKNNIWVIAGEGELKNKIEKKAKLRGLGDSIRLLGYVHHSKMPKLYSIADIFVLPSLSDPNPLSVVEASFAGLPLLLSANIGNFPETLQEGVTGWGFDPKNREETRKSIEKVIRADNESLKKMGHEAKRHAEHFFASNEVCKRLIAFLLSIEK